MEAMDALKPEIARLFASKEARRHRLAALPFPEKVRAVVRLQEMAAPVLRARGIKVRVWNLDPSTRAPAFAAGSRSGFRPTGVVEGAMGLPMGLHDRAA